MPNDNNMLQAALRAAASASASPFTGELDDAFQSLRRGCIRIQGDLNIAAESLGVSASLQNLSGHDSIEMILYVTDIKSKTDISPLAFRITVRALAVRPFELVIRGQQLDPLKPGVREVLMEPRDFAISHINSALLLIQTHIYNSLDSPLKAAMDKTKWPYKYTEERKP